MKGNFHVRCGAGEKAEITSKHYLSLLVVSDFSQPVRSTTNLLNIVDTLIKKNVKVKSLKENLDTSMRRH